MVPGALGRITLISPWGTFWSMASAGGAAGTPIKVDICNALTEAGYKVDVVMPRDQGFDPESQAPPHVDVHIIGPLRIPRRGYPTRALAFLEYILRATWRSLQIARRRGKPVATYGLGSYAVPAAWLAGKIVRRPAIGALFGTFLAPALGNWPRLLASFEEVLAFRTPVKRLVLLNDGTQADKVAKALRVPDSRVAFLMHGVDFAACDRARNSAGAAREALGVAEGQPLLVSASRLTGWKRVDRIIRLMPLVRERHPDALLAISGDGPSRSELEELTRELGLEDAVRFLGAMPRDRNLELIAAADVFCSFFDFSNVGVSLLEALSCGDAVVTLATGDTSTIVDSGRDGIVLDSYDRDAAAAEVIKLLDDEDRRRELASAAYKRSREELLDIAERKRLEVELVQELTARTPPARPRAA